MRVFLFLLILVFTNCETVKKTPLEQALASENETKGLTVLSALLTEEYLAWGFRKDDKDLLKSANDFLRTINDEGKLNQIIQYWIPPAR